MKTPIALLIATLVIVGAFAINEDPIEAASPTQFLNIGAATTTGSVSITSSARVLASTTSLTGPSYMRVYATLCNPNANPVYLALDNDQTASLTNSTYVIAAAAGYNTCYEITDRNGYNGSITASSTNQTATSITYSEYVY